MRRTAALPALVLASAPLAAQAPAPNPLHDVTAQGVVYAVPGMDRVTVRRDVPYKTADGRELKLDLYYPPGQRADAKRPAVVFINGVGDRPGSMLKEWEIYKSWGRLVAASGWIGVNFEARGNSASDIGDVFAFLRSNGAGLGVDSDRIGAWACSGNVTTGLPVLMTKVDAGVRGAVIYYGHAELPSIRKDLPVYYVRAGRDNPRLNAGIAELWKQAVAADVPWAMVNAPVSQHAFDAFDETDESRRIVRETLDFYRDLFTPPAPTGPPSLAKKALSHWFGGREYPQAAKAYAEYVKVHPDDATAWMRLGVSQAASGDAAATGEPREGGEARRRLARRPLQRRLRVFVARTEGPGTRLARPGRRGGVRRPAKPRDRRGPRQHPRHRAIPPDPGEGQGLKKHPLPRGGEGGAVRVDPGSALRAEWGLASGPFPQPSGLWTRLSEAGYRSSIFGGRIRAVHQVAAAVGTDAPELARTVDAERALERADARVGGVGRKVPIAALAAGP